MIEKRAPVLRPKVVTADSNVTGGIKSVTYGNSIFRRSGTKTIHRTKDEKYVVRGGGSLTDTGKVTAGAAGGITIGAVANKKVKKSAGGQNMSTSAFGVEHGEISKAVGYGALKNASRAFGHSVARSGGKHVPGSMGQNFSRQKKTMLTNRKATGSFKRI